MRTTSLGKIELVCACDAIMSRQVDRAKQLISSVLNQGMAHDGPPPLAESQEHTGALRGQGVPIVRDIDGAPRSQISGARVPAPADSIALATAELDQALALLAKPTPTDDILLGARDLLRAARGRVVCQRDGCAGKLRVAFDHLTHALGEKRDWNVHAGKIERAVFNIKEARHAICAPELAPAPVAALVEYRDYCWASDASVPTAREQMRVRAETFAALRGLVPISKEPLTVAHELETGCLITFDWPMRPHA